MLLSDDLLLACSSAVLSEIGVSLLYVILLIHFVFVCVRQSDACRWYANQHIRKAAGGDSRHNSKY